LRLGRRVHREVGQSPQGVMETETGRVLATVVVAG
jgi:hypothetical protein